MSEWGLFMFPKIKGDECMRILLEASNIKHFAKDRELLNIEHLHIYENEKIGLVGENGSGKSTLLNILSKNSSSDEGIVTHFTNCQLIPQLKKAIGHKSGGEVTQIYIQQVMNEKPELLLADEPTTNLDQPHIEILENDMKNWRGSFIVVSHDRAFLDAVCSTIWELKDGEITVYKGNYSHYAKAKQVEKQQEEAAYDKYISEKKQLEKAMRTKEERAERAAKIPKNRTSSEARSSASAPYYANKQKKLRKTVKALENRMNRLEDVDKPREIAPIKMTLVNEEQLKNRVIVRIEKLKAEVESKLLWNEATLQINAGEKIAIIGENGAGKTTFLKKLMNDEVGVTFTPAVKIGYFSQNLDILDLEKTILENVQESSFQNETMIRTVLARMCFQKEDVHKQVKVLSGGERVKVALSKLFLSDVNSLILDEPTNYLDIEAMEAFESLLVNYEGTVLFVSHDRRFVETVATQIISLKSKQLTLFKGNYEQFTAEKVAQPKDIEKEKMIIELKITEVLSKLSIEPSEALEVEFQNLLQQKRNMNK